MNRDKRSTVQWCHVDGRLEGRIGGECVVEEVCFLVFFLVGRFFFVDVVTAIVLGNPGKHSSFRSPPFAHDVFNNVSSMAAVAVVAVVAVVAGVAVVAVLLVQPPPPPQQNNVGQDGDHHIVNKHKETQGNIPMLNICVVIK